MTEIQLDIKYAKPDTILFTEVDGGIALMDVESGHYFHFKEIGGRIWHALDGQTSVTQICSALCEEYEVDAERCQTETVSFLKDLLDHKLISPAV